MENKTYKIKNFNDMFKVVNSENYDRFFTDFLIMFGNLIEAKNAMTKEEIKRLKLPYFEWTDDNEARVGYKFEGKEVIWLKNEK